MTKILLKRGGAIMMDGRVIGFYSPKTNSGVEVKLFTEEKSIQLRSSRDVIPYVLEIYHVRKDHDT